MKLLRKLNHTGRRFAIDMQRSSGPGKVPRVTQTPKKRVLFYLQKRLTRHSHEGPGPPPL